MLVKGNFEAQHIKIQSHDLIPRSVSAGGVVMFSEWNSDSPVIPET